jgi:hypothetical protein
MNGSPHRRRRAVLAVLSEKVCGIVFLDVNRPFER